MRGTVTEVMIGYAYHDRGAHMLCKGGGDWGKCFVVEKDK